MSQFASRHPILFAALAVLAAVIGIQLLDAGLTTLKVPELTHRLTVEAVFCGYVIFLLARSGGWHAAGFSLPVNWRRLWTFLPLLFLPVLVMVTSGLKAAGAGQVILFAVLTLMVGFAEEGLLRGVVLHALLPIGVRRAVVLSSVFFGIGHLINILQGASPTATVVQMIYSILLGIGFAGVRLYIGSIWPVILAHALIDFIDFGSRGFVLAPLPPITWAGAIAPIVITGIYGLYGWWLLTRRSAKITPLPVK
jgi:uncharacterized protein